MCITMDVRRGTATTIRQPTHSAEGRAAQVVLVLACAAEFMVVLDVSVVNVALRSIQTDLGFDAVALQWVANAYALTFAGFLLLGARLADLYGHRRVLVSGLVAFAGASLVGGLASAPETLVAARAVQGLGAAILAPATLTILTTTFPEGPARTRALATWTAVGVGGGAAGNLLGGLLTEYLSWRWILLINVPIGALAIGVAVRYLDHGNAPANHRKLDVPGAFLATVGLGALTYAITQGEARSWDNPVTVVTAAVGVIGLVSFVAVEARWAPVPLVPLSLFRRRSIWAGNAVMLLAGACLIPMWFFLSLYMRNVLGYGALQTGVAFLPHTLLTILAAWRVAPRLMDRFDHRTLVVAGLLIAAAGFAWQSRIAPDSGYLAGILGPAVLISLGGGLLNTPLTTIVTSGVDPADAGAASGLMNTAKQVGGALGLAALVVVAGGDQVGAGALAAGYARAFLVIAAVLLVAAAAARWLLDDRPPGRPSDARTPANQQPCGS